MQSSVTVAGLRILPGELLIADEDGCTKIPQGHDPAVVLETARDIRAREQKNRVFFTSPTFSIEEWRRRRREG